MIKTLFLRALHRVGFVDSTPRFVAARAGLLTSLSLGQEEKDLLGKVSLKVDVSDGMYIPGGEEHYLSVGLSAMRIIDQGMRASGRTEPVRKILDFPCGYGRALRFLRARYPEAEIFGSEFNSRALSFCQSEFRVSPIESHVDLEKYPLWSLLI